MLKLKDQSLPDLRLMVQKGQISESQRKTELRTRLVEQKKAIVRADKLITEEESSNPFWFYKPNDGTISDQAWVLLHKYLKSEDIPPRPLYSQVEVHKSEADITIAMCGNQWGKTLGEVITAIMWATGDVPLSLRDIVPKSMLPTKFPTYIRLNTVDKELLSENILPKFQEYVPKERLKNGSWEKSYSAMHNNLTLYDKRTLISTIQFKTYQQDVMSFQGVRLDGLLNDEQPPEDIQKENEKRFRTAKRMKQFWAMTPTLGMTDWVYDMLENDNVFWFNSPSVVNRFVNLNILDEELSNETNYEAIKTTLLGVMTSLSGLIYSGLFDQRVHVIEPFEITSKEFLVYRGLDPHTAKPNVWVNVAVDRSGNRYVCGAGEIVGDTQELKDKMADQARTRKYRLGKTVCDQWVDTENKLLKQNVFQLLGRGKNAIPALDLSDKRDGSIKAGVDVIKKGLRKHPISGVPQLYFFNTPEVKPLIKSMKRLEREKSRNEDKVGKKDKISEGKHDYHAALRYVHQVHLNWFPPMQKVPEYKPMSARTAY